MRHKVHSCKISKGILSGEKDIIHDINIGDAILNAFKSRPNFIGQVGAETEEQITFQQMRKNSVKCALWLQRKGFADGDTITICIRNQMVAYIPLLASIYIGAIVSPWDYKYLSSDVQTLFFLLTHESKVIFVDDPIVALYLQLAIGFLWQYKRRQISPKIVVLNNVENFDSLELILNGHFDEVEIDEFSCVKKNLTVPMFTTNVTTYPDITKIPAVVFMMPSNQQIPIMFANDVGLWYGSLCWTHSLLLTFRTIISYVTMIKSSKFSEINLYETIEKYKVSWVFLDSYMCNQLLQTDIITKYDFSSLREFVFDNSAIACVIHEELVKSLPNVFIIQIYSALEKKLIYAYQRNNENTESIGHIANNIELKFIDPLTKKPVAPYVSSEIWYRFLYRLCSDFNSNTCEFPICKNYKTRRSILKHQGSNKYKFSKWQYTGGLGYYDEDGNIFVTDRTKHLIKYKNFHVSSTQIENLFKPHPAVSKVVVTPVHRTDGHHPTAYVKKKHEAKETEKKLIQLVKENLDKYELREDLFFKNKILHLSNDRSNKN